MGKYMQIFKASGAGAAGGITAVAGSLLLGMAVGIPGAILMILGVALGLGFNAGGLMNGIGNQI
jgi:hypothetical protein